MELGNYRKQKTDCKTPLNSERARVRPSSALSFLRVMSPSRKRKRGTFCEENDIEGGRGRSGGEGGREGEGRGLTALRWPFTPRTAAPADRLN